jgi:hypothetical protein
MSYTDVIKKQQYEDTDHEQLRVKLINLILNTNPRVFTPLDANAIAMTILNASYYDAIPTDEMDRLIQVALK